MAAKLYPKILCLKAVKSDFTTKDNFKWPKKGKVTCPDFKPTKECGNGLHAWGPGQKLGQSGAGWCTEPTAKDLNWLVVEVSTNPANFVDLGEKVKFKSGNVLMAGTLHECAAFVSAHGVICDYGTATAGYCGTATAGDNGTATAGDSGKATAGDNGTATAGYCGTATAGNYGTATAGDNGTATAGYCGTATAGNYGTATAGNYGTATAGDCGKATAGDCGKATAGDNGTATAGNYGKATAGYCGTIQIQAGNKVIVGKVGEKGILPNTQYCVVNGKLRKVTQ